MKNTLVLLLMVLSLAGCKSCKEADNGNFKVNLQAFVGTQPLSFTNTIYNDGGGKEFYLNKFKFYLSNIKLIRPDNSEVKVEDAAFFDWETRKSFSANVDAGTYKGIHFFVGLDPIQNATNPDDYSSTEALGPHDDTYWEWLKHRFIVLEGRADTLGQNFSNSIGLAYHVGRDTCYREVILTGTDFTINTSADKAINLNVDLLKVFNQSPEPINLFTQPGTQSEDSDLPIAIQFANQFSKSFSYSE